MKRAEAMARLRAHEAELRRLGVQHLYLPDAAPLVARLDGVSNHQCDFDGRTFVKRLNLKYGSLLYTVEVFRAGIIRIYENFAQSRGGNNDFGPVLFLTLQSEGQSFP